MNCSKQKKNKQKNIVHIAFVSFCFLEDGQGSIGRIEDMLDGARSMCRRFDVG